MGDLNFVVFIENYFTLTKVIAWCQWLTPVILPTWGTEIMRNMVPDQPGQNGSKTRSQPITGCSAAHLSSLSSS
jgi:hypothetical protein